MFKAFFLLLRLFCGKLRSAIQIKDINQVLVQIRKEMIMNEVKIHS